jgi:hypothetical protein
METTDGGKESKDRHGHFRKIISPNSIFDYEINGAFVRMKRRTAKGRSMSDALYQIVKNRLREREEIERPTDENE